METALLQYPMEKVFNRLQKILKKKGFIITSTNEAFGKISAHKRRFLQKRLLLDISTSKINEKATRIDMTIDGAPNLFSKILPAEKNTEKELWNKIYDSF